MIRMVCCAVIVPVLIALTPTVRAGELDRESTPAKKSVAMRAPSGGSELDSESPQSAHGWRWGHRHWGGWGGWGWGGFGPARFSYFNFGFPAFYQPWGFSSGFSLSFGYRSFFPTYFYSPFFWW